MEELLIQNDYVKENIWTYNPSQFQKSSLYYAILDKKYYKDELKMILRQETGVESDDCKCLMELIQ